MRSLMMDKLALQIFVVTKHNSKLVLLTWRDKNSIL